MKMNKMMKKKMKVKTMNMKMMMKMEMKMMMRAEFPWGCAHCLVAQRQFGLGSLEARRDSTWPVLPTEQAREPPAAT